MPVWTETGMVVLAGGLKSPGASSANRSLASPRTCADSSDHAVTLERARGAEYLKERLPRPPGGHLGIAALPGPPARAPLCAGPQGFSGVARVRNIADRIGGIIDRAADSGKGTSPSGATQGPQGGGDLGHKLWAVRHQPLLPTGASATYEHPETCHRVYTSHSKLRSERNRHVREGLGCPDSARLVGALPGLTSQEVGWDAAKHRPKPPAFPVAVSPMTAFAHGMRAMRAGSDPDDD